MFGGLKNLLKYVKVIPTVSDVMAEPIIKITNQPLYFQVENINTTQY